MQDFDKARQESVTGYFIPFSRKVKQVVESGSEDAAGNLLNTIAERMEHFLRYTTFQTESISDPFISNEGITIGCSSEALVMALAVDLGSACELPRLLTQEELNEYVAESELLRRDDMLMAASAQGHAFKFH